MKNSPAHKKNVVIKISRKKSVGMVKQKKFDDWYMGQIRNTMFSMKTDETRTIKVTRR